MGDALGREVPILADFGRIEIKFHTALGADDPAASPSGAFFHHKVMIVADEGAAGGGEDGAGAIFVSGVTGEAAGVSLYILL